MIEDHLGFRFKNIRIEICKESQEEFCNTINSYIFKNHNDQYNELNFNQPKLSGFEKENKITSKKLTLLINFLHIKKNINPSWFILKRNENQPKYIKGLEIDQTMVEIRKNIEIKYEEMFEDINTLTILIDNSVYKQ